jgi:hypothetical protein
MTTAPSIVKSQVYAVPSLKSQQLQEEWNRLPWPYRLMGIIKDVVDHMINPF